MEETELRSVVRQMRQTAVTISLLSGQEKDHILHTLPACWTGENQILLKPMGKIWNGLFQGACPKR